MYTKVVNVLASTGGGTQDITFTPNGSDPSWTPKIAIFQWNRAVTATSTWTEHVSYGFGFTDGTNSRCVAYASEDNQTRADSGRIQRNDALICALNPSGTVETVDAVAEFSQWLSNGIQINWTDAPAAQFYITVTFLGGNDITNVDVGTLATGTGTGNISVTSLAYQPDFGLFLSGCDASENTGLSTAFISLGAATSSDAQWVQTAYTQDNPGTMLTCQYYSHGKVVVSNYSAVDGYATFSSFNSNGFTLNVGDAFPASHPIYYLVIKGGNYAVGNDTEPANTGNQTITTNKDTKAVMVFGVDLSLIDTLYTDCVWSAGCCDSALNQYGHVFHDTNAAANSIVVSAIDGASHIYNNITANATAGSTVWDDSAIVYSVSSTGFVLNWDNVGNARPFRYITFGSGAGVNQAPISETAISVSDSIDPTFYLTKSISESSVSVSENLDPTVSYGKTISEDSVNVGAGSVTVSRTFTISISEPEVTVSAETIDDIEYYQKKISNDPPISASDSIDTTTSYTKSISDSPVISTGDSVEATKIPAGPTATIYYVHFVEFPEDAIDSSLVVIKVEGRVTAPKTHKWNTIAKVTASKTHKWNAVNAVSTTKTHKWNAIIVVSRTVTHLYDLINKIEQTKTHKYNIFHTLTSQKTHLYDVVASVSTTKTHKYNVSEGLEQVSTTKTHKYNVLEQITTSKTHLYNLAGAVSTTKTHLYNVFEVVSTTKTHKYTLLNTVSTTKTHLYDVIEKVTTSKTHKYNLSGVVSTTKTHLYNVLGVITEVSTTKTHIYSIIERVTTSKTHIYNIVNAVSTTKTHKYNLICKVVAPKTHLYDVEKLVSTTKTHVYSLLESIGVASKTHKYHIRIGVTTTKTHKYNIISKISRTHTHRWNSGGIVRLTKKHIYDLGESFELPIGAGSSTVAHIRFPERVSILDIISNINNKAVANVELRPFGPKIICVGVVEINEAQISPIVRTASGKARHRIVSTLIIPPIIDTIENLAVSGRIGLEELPLPNTPQFRIVSSLQLHPQTKHHLYLFAQTQIKEDPRDVIRLSSTTEILPRAQTRISSIANLQQLEFLNNIQFTSDIMTREYEQTVRTLIEILKNDEIFK